MLSLFHYSESDPLLFTQLRFWLLFAGLMAAYALVYKRVGARNLLLLGFSLWFYYLSSGWNVLLLVVSTLADYHIGFRIHRARAKAAKQTWLALSVAVNLSLLAYFKYAYFFADTLSYAMGSETKAVNVFRWLGNRFLNPEVFQFDVSRILLPVGVSFFTFQTISYAVDVYRGKLKPVDSVLDFGLYVSFFPQLVAGPIVRAAEFVPQLYRRYALTDEQFGRAVFLILAGMVKKVVISDYLSTNFVDRVFEAPAAYSGLENLMAFYAYALQIYCDFSGYTDMAIGVALLLGFQLPENFRSPYKAADIADFWRRWHISLSSWLRDYLYIPLGGSRHGPLVTFWALATTMLLGGLWHGADWFFVLWGAMHGGALVVHRAWRYFVERNRLDVDTLPFRLLGWAMTLHFVGFCWVFFRIGSFRGLSFGEKWQRMEAFFDQISHHFGRFTFAEVWTAYAPVLGVMALGYALHFLPQGWKDGLLSAFTRLPDVAKAVLAAAVVLLVYQVASAESRPFIYFQF